MMKKTARIWAAISAAILLSSALAEAATIQVTPGSGTTFWLPSTTSSSPASGQVWTGVSIVGLLGDNQVDVTSGNALKVDASSTTQPISGTVTANLGTLNGAATAANQTAVQGSLAGGTAATNSEAIGGVYNSTLPTLTSGQQAAEQLDANGRQIVTLQAPVGGGWAPLLENGLTTTVKSVKASAGQLGMLQCYNPNSAQIYVQVFNIASGSVTLGTSTPLQSYAIAPGSTGGLAMSSVGIQFSTAISIAATTTATGSTAPSTAIDCNVAYN